MNKSSFEATTLDDAMREVIQALAAYGDRITPTKGPAVELTGVLIEIANPRARLSRTESRGKPFSCLGEFCWYLSGSNKLDQIAYYLPNYQDFAEGESIYGAYGPRLFNWGGHNQVSAITALLRGKKDSRQAVIQLFDRSDLFERHKDIPCTCSIQFLIRKEQLCVIVTMRSNDVYLGLPHDVFCFTMLQEILARELSLEPGSYKHAVGSLHYYTKDEIGLRAYLNEGFQSTVAMPAMPEGSPWEAIGRVLEFEKRIRMEQVLIIEPLAELDPYWADLVRLLQTFRASKDKDADGLKAIADSFSSQVYRPFVSARLTALEKGNSTLGAEKEG